MEGLHSAQLAYLTDLIAAQTFNLSGLPSAQFPLIVRVSFLSNRF